MIDAGPESALLENAVLYDSIGPNPRVVRMFAAEKALNLQTRRIDIMGGENRRPMFIEKNPTGGTPVLELANGTCISETVAICEFLEEVTGASPLLGVGPIERALVRMWTRRIDLNFCAPLVLSFRGSLGRAMFEPRMRVVAASAAADLKMIAVDNLHQMEKRLGASSYLAGRDFTLADIMFFCFIEFGAKIGLLPLEGLSHIKMWSDQVRLRACAQA